MSDHRRDEDDEDLDGRIAIIGMAGRFPGSPDLTTFWASLRDGVEAVRFYSDEELLAAGESPELLNDVNYVRAAAPLADIDKFDAAFFGMSPRDAAVFDPQHRFFLECAWEAFEHAGVVPSESLGSVGVFASCGLSDYMFKNVLANAEMRTSVGEWLIRHTGNDTNFLATRVSYEMDLRGPSMNVQTACSSTLVAVHQACQSILNGECDMALAGGAVIAPIQDRGYLYKEGEILSPDGHCRAFDEKSAGTILASAAGCVLLKPLRAALDDGDNVLAVIRGSAINNDGRAKVGYLAPSVDGQARVVTEALSVAGVAARDVTYVEAHGTGTLIGDPIEIAGLTQAYRLDTNDVQFCAIGSLKTNIGHTGEASGIGALIKTVLSLQHRQLPPSLHFNSPNPQADLPSSPFYVNDELRNWAVAPGKKRIAGITNLGAGGTNAHLIVEEAPNLPASQPTVGLQLVTVSARSDEAADRATAALAAHLRAHPDLSLADVAHTRLAGRRQFRARRAVVAASVTEAAEALEAGDARSLVRHHHRGGAPSVVFLAPGGGAQYPGMGRELYDTEPAYRRTIDECAAFLRRSAGIDLLAALYPRHVTDEATLQLERPSVALPALYATTMATAAMLQSWGIVPAAMIGHSAGEYAVASLAGVFSRDDGLALVALRGRLFETLDAGGMLSVALGEDALRSRLPAGLSIAAINSADLCVAAGPVALIAELESQLQAEDIDCSRVHIDVAAHSAMLDPILAEFESFCRTIRFSPPTIPYVSNLTGDWVTPAQVADPRYWVDHLRGTVRFRDGIERILGDANRTLVEIGPGRTLIGFAQRASTKATGVTATLRHPREDASDRVVALRALGRIWASGVDLDADLLVQGEAPHRIPLPTYPFERDRYWVDPDPPAAVVAQPATADLVKRSDVADWFYVPGWRRSVAPVAREQQGAYRWMIIGDASRVAGDLAAQLETGGNTVVAVTFGSRFRAHDDDRFDLDPSRREHWTQLFDALREGRGLPDHIVQITAIGEPRRWNRGGDLAAYDELVHRDEAGLIHLAQAVSSLAHPLRLTVVTSGVHAVDGTESLHPERALLHGVSRVIPRELAHVRSSVIDIEVPGGIARRRYDHGTVIALLAKELGGDADDDVVAYRAGARWVRAFDPVRLAHAAASTWPRDGVVLITGGLGGIGLAVAEGVARDAPGATLVLVGRTPLPSPDTWPAVLADGAADPVLRHRIESLLRIRSAGATAIVVTADITDLHAMRIELDRVHATYGRIHTVVHSAGVLQDALIALRDPSITSPVVEVKARGILVLQELLARTPPQRWVLFSSVSSILGLPGQADYTAANAFLDAFAAKVNAAGGSRALVVNWNAWQQVGMAVDAMRTPVQPPSRARPTTDLQSPVELFDEIADDGELVVATTAFSRERHWLLAEHVVRGGGSLIPGTGFLELIREVATAGNQPSLQVEMRDVMFLAPFVVVAEEVRRLTVKLDRTTGQVVVFATSEYEPNVTAWIDVPATEDVPVHVDLEAVRRRCTNGVDHFDGYLDQSFMQFGPRWGVLRRVEYGEAEAIVTTSVPAEFVGELDAMWLHPAVLDMATGSAQALIPSFEADQTFFVPLSYSRVLVRRPLPAEAVSVVRLRPGAAADIAVFDISICDADGLEAIHIEGYTMRRVARSFANATPGVPVRAEAFGLESPINDALRVGMLPDEGVDALHRALSVDLGSQIVASSVDLHHWIAKVDAEAIVLDDIDDAAVSGLPSYGRPQLSAAFEEPSTPIERELARVWRELLGIDRVGRDDDFFELGGQSLVALRLFAWIRRQYSVDMPLSTLFEAPSIAQCARVIAAQLGIHETPGADVDDQPLSGADAPSPSATLAVSPGTAVMPVPAVARSLVLISSAGKGRPFFIVHGAGGNILFLWGLARSLAGDRPIYGFQAMGVNATDAPDQTVEEMATRYVRELVADHDGPYLLGGYSGGGCVALEMTRQLQAMGEVVQHVVLLDGLPVDLPPGRPPRVQRVRNLIDNARLTGFDSTWRYVTGLARRRVERLLPERRRSTSHRSTAEYALGMVHVEGYVDLFDHFTEISPRYHVGEYDVDVTLLKADDIAPIFAWDYDWTDHIHGSLAIHTVAGDHHTMFYPEHSPGLADKVRTVLADAELRSAGSGPVRSAPRPRRAQPRRPPRRASR